MTEEPNYAAMWKELSTLCDEGEYEAFLRRQSLEGDHSFLLYSIRQSNLRPAVRKVLEELISFGKVRRADHRPRRQPNETHMIGLRRALCVMDIEEAGFNKRDAAIEKAKQQLGLTYSTIEKAVLKYQGVIKSIKATAPELLDQFRAAFK